MRLPQVQLLYVLEALSVDSYRRLFPLEKSHSSDLEPHASPGLSECERRNLKLNTLPRASTALKTCYQTAKDRGAPNSNPDPKAHQAQAESLNTERPEQAFNL